MKQAIVALLGLTISGSAFAGTASCWVGGTDLSVPTEWYSKKEIRVEIPSGPYQEVELVDRAGFKTTVTVGYDLIWKVSVTHAKSGAKAVTLVNRNPSTDRKDTALHVGEEWAAVECELVK